MKLIVNLNEQGLKQIAEYRAFHASRSDLELINRYNKEQGMGFVMVTSRTYFLYAMREEFIRRFGKSPLTLEGGCAIGFSGPIIPTESGYTTPGETASSN